VLKLKKNNFGAKRLNARTDNSAMQVQDF